MNQLLVGLLIAVVAWGHTGVGVAQDRSDSISDAGEFIGRVRAVMQDGNLDRLERARALKRLADEEEHAVMQMSIRKWVDDLGSVKFAERAEARKELAATEAAAIESLVAGADDPDLERAKSCLDLLVQLSKNPIESIREAAIKAVLRVSQSERSPVHHAASNHHASLIQTDEQRATLAFEAAGARLYRGPDGEVRSISVHRGTLGDSELKLISAFPAVHSVTLQGVRVTDAGVKYLAELPSLRTLTISDSALTDSGLRSLTKLKRLDRLSLGKAAYTEQGLCELVRSMQLRSISLYGAPLTPAVVQALNNSAALTHVTVSLRESSAQCLPILKDLKKLSLLSIHDAGVKDADLEGLTALPIRNLTISGAEISGKGLKWICQMKSLGSLNLTTKHLTDDDLPELAKLQSIESLFLTGSEFTDAGLTHLSTLSGLRTLAITGTKITDEGVEPLKKLKSLRFLGLSGAQLSDAAKQELQDALPNCRLSH